MQTLPCVLSLSLVLGASLVSAQESKLTEAQQDGLAGPVKSVSTTVTMTGAKWQQPGGPTLVLPAWCRDCTYDPDGTRTMSGQVVDGKFQGDLETLTRDGNGHLTDRVVANASTGQVSRHEVWGPRGKTEETDYIDGKLHWRQTFTYDQSGRMSDSVTVDEAGNEESRAATRRTSDGTVTERSAWGKSGLLSWQETYDPNKDQERFSSYDDAGALKVAYTFAHGQVTSFWEATDAPNQFGQSFIADQGKGNVDAFQCQFDGRCDRSQVHYEYLEPAKKRNPASAEWRDQEGQLQYAAYCEYELDSQGNWTHRKVTVWSTGMGGRALYEEDARSIVYWPQ